LVTTASRKLRSGGRAVQSAPSLPQKLGDVVRLENISAKKHAGCTCSDCSSDDLQGLFIRALPSTAEHQYGNRTGFHDFCHGSRISSVFSLDKIGTDLGSDARV